MATILPLIPIGLLALAVASLVGSRNHVGMVVSTLWFGAILVVALTLVAVVASRLYQLIGDRLNVPLR
jgi:tellurite resistance protein TehA-like permease